MWIIPEALQPVILAGILSLVGGILLEKFRNKQPKILYYLSNISDFQVPSTTREGQQQTIFVNTHSIVVQNAGRAPAHNIEVVHRPIADQNFWFRINPDITYSEGRTPEGGRILKFPHLLPGQMVTISYLYTYPHQIQHIHNYVKSDEVAGQAINVFHVMQTPKWLQHIFLWLAFLGVIYAGQLLWVGIINFIRWVK